LIGIGIGLIVGSWKKKIKQKNYNTWLNWELFRRNLKLINCNNLRTKPKNVSLSQ
jgi:hypothetical protein